MNLAKLFEMQKELDDYIVETKGLQGEDLLPRKILALQVELGECANEWRGFKFWSEDQSPRYEKKSIAFANPSGPFEYTTHPLLEEYTDCLHFILSIGITIGYEPVTLREYSSIADITYMFTLLPFYAYSLFDLCDQEAEDYSIESAYDDLFAGFLFLGEKLGFTWVQIESAYIDKWKINKQRQASGY